MGCNQTNSKKEDNSKLYNQACEYEQIGELRKAIPILTEALKIDPNDLGCYNNRAWDYFDLGDKQKAISDFNEILKIDSLNTAGIYGLAFIQFKEGNYEKAIQLFDKIIKLKGGGPIYLEMVDNEAISQRAPLEANINQVYEYKNLALEELKKQTLTVKLKSIKTLFSLTVRLHYGNLYRTSRQKKLLARVAEVKRKNRLAWQ